MSDQALLQAKERLLASREALVWELQDRVRPVSRRTATARRAERAGQYRATAAMQREAVPTSSVPADDAGERASARAVKPVRVASFPTSSAGANPSSGARGWSRLAREGVRAWWELHPARAVVAIGEPFLYEVARRRPFQLLAASAGLGAAITMLRPWRAISPGKLALMALRSSQASRIALSFLGSRRA